ncbi:hypothetical protein C0J52_13078 [Blattella germanica]|nr:hypothetical protein C0J52_13078 [Blattella germanica]
MLPIMLTLFVRSRIVVLDIPSSAARLRVDLIGDCSIKARTPAHVSSRVFFLPLRGLSLTLPKAKARLSQSRSVAFRRGALLNLSWNAPIICAINSNN